jgi:hypothetical protein
MTTGEILFLTLVIGVVVVFSIGLAWASAGARGPEEPKPGEFESGV